MGADHGPLLSSREFHAFRDKERWILYRLDTHSASYEDEVAIRVLEHFRHPSRLSRLEPLYLKSGKSQVTRAIERLFEDGLLVKADFNGRSLPSQPLPLPRETLPLYLNVNVSQECNLKCVYCYAESGTYGAPSLMTLRTALRAVDFLFECADRQKDERLAFTFFGGEPLLNPDVLRETAAYIRRREQEAGRAVEISIITNGTLIDEEMARFLSQHGIRVTISVDGPRQVHDALRPSITGFSSYEAAIRGLEYLKRYGARDIGARATITKANLDIAAICGHLLAAGFDVVGYSPVRDESGKFAPGVEHLDKLQLGLEAAATNFLQTVFEKRRFAIVNYVMPIVRLYTRSRAHNVCGAGRSMFHVSADGRIFPCQSFYSFNQFQLGDLYRGFDEKRLEKFRSQLDVDTRRGCRSCRLRYLCGGECYHYSLLTTGDISHPDHRYCRYTRKLIEISMALYLEILEREPDLLLSLIMMYSTTLVAKPLRDYMYRLLVGDGEAASAETRKVPGVAGNG